MQSSGSAFVAFPAALLIAVPAVAGEAPDYHDAGSTDIIVSAPIHQDRMDILSGASVLTGARLAAKLRPTLGETLRHTPGVSATSFGPNASRPVLRGLQGERIRVLTDGIGSVDVSNTSVDHAVVINPLLAERIEVLRGPEALLYGSAAIGGVVNVIDRRIPRAIPDEPIHVDATATFGSAASERSGGVALDAPIAGGLVMHLDGSYLKTGNLRIGGHVLSRGARAEAAASALLQPDGQAGEPIDFAGNAALRDRLPNSAARTWVTGVGLALVNGDSHYGISYSRYESRYGVPIRFATLPGAEQEAPRIDLAQDRIDARAEIAMAGPLIKTIRARFAYARYRHFELEEDGTVASAFRNRGYEGRFEIVQADRGIWHGASGVQVFSRDLDAAGDEAFVPRNRTTQFGLFTLQHLDFGAFKLEGGLRYERSRISARPLADQPQFSRARRDFDTVSASLGASLKLDPNWRIGANLVRSARAPSAEEMFANGPHAGTEAYEIGNPAFRTEKSWGIEGVIHGKGPGFSVDASLYHSWFDDFIYDSPDGTLLDGLPVFRNFQAPARYYGAEIEGTFELATFGDVRIEADALADYVHATIVGNGPAPRIPPLRLLGGLTAGSDRIDGRIEVEWTDKARRLAAFETPTGGSSIVNASLTFRPLTDNPGAYLILSVNNIFDVSARRHASYLKDFAPLAGRDIRLTARISY